MAPPTHGGTFQPLQHKSGALRDRLHSYTKSTLGAGGSINEAVRWFAIYFVAVVGFLLGKCFDSPILVLSSSSFLAAVQVALPHGESCAAWVAVHAIDFFNDLTTIWAVGTFVNPFRFTIHSATFLLI